MSQQQITNFFGRQSGSSSNDTNYLNTSVIGSLKQKKKSFNDGVAERKISRTEGAENRLSQDQPEKITAFVEKKTIFSDNLMLSNDTSYNPAAVKYDPVEHAVWKKNECVPYLALAKTFQLVEETRGRQDSIELLGNFFWSVIKLSPDDLLPAVYLSLNQLGPAYEGIELGVAETYLMKAICNTTGRTLAHIKTQSKTIGDLGLVAEQSRISQRRMIQPPPLNVQGIYKNLCKIANSSGKPKLDMVQDIFVACRFVEARYFIRSLLGKLRIGIAEQSLLGALASAFVKSNMETDDVYKKSYQESLKRTIEDAKMILKVVYSQCPNFDKLISTALKTGLSDLQDRCPMQPGIPIKPMLAQSTRGIREVLDRLDGLLITCEYKYDGERAQIHCASNGEISIFSRNQENNTKKYPDLIDCIDKFKKEGVTSYMIDSEIVAWDEERKKILPFQILATRKRKNVTIEDIKVKVCVFVFDLLYVNGTSLVSKNLSERRKLLKEHFNEVQGKWCFPIHCDTNNMEEIQVVLEESIKGNCEGLMIKTLDANATYEIARRSHNWLKLKKDYLSNCGDSLDLVVIGGYKGKGKRTGFYGGFLLACYDTDNEEFQSICKIGTGFADDDLKKSSEYFQNHLIEAPKLYYRYDTSLKPDAWFEPIQVWEVKCADLSLSPIHRAAIGIVDAEKGISLRFPRFIRIRLDKKTEAATSAMQVAQMYNSQDQIKNTKTEKGYNDFDDYY